MFLRAVRKSDGYKVTVYGKVLTPAMSDALAIGALEAGGEWEFFQGRDEESLSPFDAAAHLARKAKEGWIVIARDGSRRHQMAGRDPEPLESWLKRAKPELS